MFAALGYPDAAERQTRATADPHAYNQILEKRHSTQAAALLSLNQRKDSPLRHDQLDGFSVEPPMPLPTALDRDAGTVTRKKPRARPSARPHVAA